MRAAQLRNGTTSSTVLWTTNSSLLASKRNLRGNNRPVAARRAPLVDEEAHFVAFSTMADGIAGRINAIPFLPEP